jgi:hypothetical protein
MSAVLDQQTVKELEELRKQLIETLNDYWDSQVFLGNTKELHRFTSHLKRFFKLEMKTKRLKAE